MFHLTTHSIHFIWLDDVEYMVQMHPVREETRYCHFICHSFRLAAPSHRQDSTYHDRYYTSCSTLAETRNSSMGPL